MTQITIDLLEEDHAAVVAIATAGGQTLAIVAVNLIREALEERRRPHVELALAYEALARAAAYAGDESRALYYVGLAHDARTREG